MTTRTMKQAQREASPTFDHRQVTIIIETLPALSEHPDFQAGLRDAQQQFLEDYEAAPLTEDEMMGKVESNGRSLRD